MGNWKIENGGLHNPKGSRRNGTPKSKESSSRYRHFFFLFKPLVPSSSFFSSFEFLFILGMVDFLWFLRELLEHRM